MNVSAYVAHRSPGRTRIKVRSQRGNAEYFAELKRRLSQCPGVSGTKANFRTGSLLIIHKTPLPQIISFAQTHSLFTLNSQSEIGHQSPSLLHRAKQGLSKADSEIARLTQGYIDVRSLVLILLVTASTVQVVRGQILAPTSTLLWYALELITSPKPTA